MLRVYVWFKDVYNNLSWSDGIKICVILIALFLFGSILLGLTRAAQSRSTLIPVPSCQEDELVVGIGNFNNDGYWDEYICVHPDTIING